VKRAIAITALLAATLPAAADWRAGEWRIARPIAVPKMSVAGLIYLPLDDTALAIRSLSEYRVVRDGRIEVPYKMVAEQGQIETRIIPTRVLSQGTLPKEQAQVLVDLGPSAPSANQVRLRLRGDNFRSRVRVEGSPDGGRWWLLTGDGLVYRHEGRFEKTRVAIPANNYRFLRVTLSRLEGKLPVIERIESASEVSVPRRLVAVAARLSRRQEKRERRTRLDLRMELLTRDLSEARFEIEEPIFDRPVTIEASADGKEYFWVGEASLRRLTPGKDAVVQLQVPEARRLRIYISNGDDRPLTIRGVTLWRVRRGLVFSADPGHLYELWYGRRNAAEPVYDIQRLPLTASLAKLPVAALGPERKLPPKPPPPPPWSEQHRALFWGVLAAVVVLLAIVIVRAMRSARQAPPAA
jgi:hypothetical protein